MRESNPIQPIATPLPSRPPRFVLFRPHTVTPKRTDPSDPLRACAFSLLPFPPLSTQDSAGRSTHSARPHSSSLHIHRPAFTVQHFPTSPFLLDDDFHRLHT